MHKTRTPLALGRLQGGGFHFDAKTMGLADQDFEKGEAHGTADALELLETVAAALTT
jgi:hypothetical protein